MITNGDGCWILSRRGTARTLYNMRPRSMRREMRYTGARGVRHRRQRQWQDNEDKDERCRWLRVYVYVMAHRSGR